MSDERQGNSAGWTFDTLWLLLQERDRRYTEVAVERTRALEIKAAEGEKALILAREIQTYKDMIHNGTLDTLRSGQALYATKAEVIAVTEKIAETMKPLAEYVVTMQGRSSGFKDKWGYAIGALALAVAVASYFSRH